MSMRTSFAVKNGDGFGTSGGEITLLLPLIQWRDKLLAAVPA